MPVVSDNRKVSDFVETDNILRIRTRELGV